MFKLSQTKKFYITSFLKNQTYFTPIFVLFLEANHLSVQEIFWVLTIGSIVSFLMEIPTGIIADLYGKRRSIIIAKWGIFISYLAFAFSNSFWHFVIAQVIFELGNVFRSGTETAYTFDYLDQNKNKRGVPGYTKVKGGQKFYARIGEAIATAIGGFIASIWNFEMVFIFASIPALFNALLGMSWEKIKENKEIITIKESLKHAKNATKEIIITNGVSKIVLNITVFTIVIAAITTFLQPYMKETGVPIAYFGIIYSIILGLGAIAVKYSYLIEDKLGPIKTLNWFSAFAIIPLLIIGSHFTNYLGIALFFLVIIIENIRSPIANGEFNERLSSKHRATTGSILALFKSLGKSLFLPIIGAIVGIYDLYTACLFLAGLLVINSLFLKMKPAK